MTPQVLVAGVGNIFFGDDAFGVEVAQRLSARGGRAGVEVRDFGIRGFDLACALDGVDLAILVDAYPHGAAPGDLVVVEPDLDDPIGPIGPGGAAEPAGVEGHGLDPVNVLRLARAMNIAPGRLLVVGCEPLTLGGEHGAMGLSGPIRAAADRAIAIIDDLVDEALAGAPPAREAG